MLKIHSGVTNKPNHNIHQQPKTEKQNKSAKVEKEHKPAEFQPQHTAAPVKAKTNPPPPHTTLTNGLAGDLLKLKLEAKLKKAETAANTRKSKVHVTYVPYNKRHQSKYDAQPPFSRPPGSPDRDRAINPSTGDFYFPIKENSVLMDGNGVPRGTIDWGRLKLNFGQVKTINNERCYYTVGITITDKNGVKSPASGWIKESSIQPGNEPKFTLNQIKKSQPPDLLEEFPKLKEKDFREYEVMNVAPQEIRDADGKSKYGYMRNGEFVSYKVKPEVSEARNVEAGDYLRRDGNVINLGFNAAGMSNDTFQTDGEPVVFHRAPNEVKGTTIEIDLYHPKDDDHAGKKPVGRMRFVYGYVETQGTKRWGWMPLGALKLKN